MHKVLSLLKLNICHRRVLVCCCSDDDAKTNVTRLKHSGMPPVTPQACVKDNITGAAFDFIWAEVGLGNTDCAIVVFHNCQVSILHQETVI